MVLSRLSEAESTAGLARAKHLKQVSLLLVGGSHELARRVGEALGDARQLAFSSIDLSDETRLGDALASADVALILPASLTRLRDQDMKEAEAVLSACARNRPRHVIVASSATVYGARPNNPGLIPETRPLLALLRDARDADWQRYEALASQLSRQAIKVTILRACPVPLLFGEDLFSRLFSGRLALTLAGHDPSIQLLSPVDLAHAIACAATRSEGGVYNVAPDGVIPLRKALQVAQAWRLPIPRNLHAVARGVLAPLGLAHPADQIDYIRYSFTISNRKIKRDIGFAPSRSSLDTLVEFLREAAPAREPPLHGVREFDDFGMDKEFIAAGGRSLFAFLTERYWRIDVEGLEHVPKVGKGILVGIHRGLVAWDGVMILSLLVHRLNRFPRFLVHPTGFRFPFVFDVTTKLGGIAACQENADWVLEKNELLGIFPEGIRGVFSLYREAYDIRKFGRHDFVKMALRHKAPIIPFAIVGSAETYPILGKVDWSWWKRKTEWPFFPLTPTLFPLFPAPLPSKWRIRFLPAVDVGSKHPPEAARNARLVQSISDDVRRTMQEATLEMAKERKSIFFG